MLAVLMRNFCVQVIGVDHNSFFVAEQKLTHIYSGHFLFHVTVSGGMTPILNNFVPPQSVPFIMSAQIDLRLDSQRWTTNRPPRSSSPIYVTTYPLDGDMYFPMLIEDDDGDLVNVSISSPTFDSNVPTSAQLPAGLRFNTTSGNFKWSTQLLTDDDRGLWMLSATIGDEWNNGSCCRSATAVWFGLRVLNYQLSGVRR